MAWLEILLIAAIIGGALFTLYRYFWQKQGRCPGCNSETCPSKQMHKNS
ncbi:hypothetical protein [Desulfobacca acetoxidans]|uniref:FeoB-associated Cys-rich membrane protein n=1 Tax=Desulfobacca acetoxidans (strain ATCC 700848 / DSM 11109 / ASRB2) TaxID=880072 RepID=F2NEN7_DESAR|nr:hypothetical protein [Desulfobacca acetoxidans]AEB08227.1 hypothetical protein Desac_0336 [Desulfobacca acetoxidans DSM 11109]